MEDLLTNDDVIWTIDLQPISVFPSFFRYASYNTDNVFVVSVAKLVNIEPDGDTKTMVMVTGIL